MKQIVASKVVDIPSDVKFEVKARKVRVKGARGGAFSLQECCAHDHSYQMAYWKHATGQQLLLALWAWDTCSDVCQSAVVQLPRER
jgi:hypothetical protein